tara:strand:+ start:135 stop:368 length:234 start_codon:yes stop_codon:yes gene_type:complete
MNNIKEYINKSGYKVEFIAEQIGCHKTEIAQWSSERRKPTRERLRKLCDILLTSPKIKKCNMKDLLPNIKFTKEIKN